MHCSSHTCARMCQAYTVDKYQSRFISGEQKLHTCNSINGFSHTNTDYGTSL